MKRYKEAVINAAHDTAGYMTQQLRHSALQHGWKPEVAESLSISYKDDNFHSSSTPEHESAAWKHEYGDEHTRPTAVQRKFGGNADHLDSAFLISLERHLGGSI